VPAWVYGPQQAITIDRHVKVRARDHETNFPFFSISFTDLAQQIA
jgi:hypothetical protein